MLLPKLNTYLTLIGRGFGKAIEYRSEIFVWLLLDTMPLVVLLLVWSSIFQHTSDLKGFTLSQMMSYYIWISIIAGITNTHFESWRVKEIREGKIDFYLTKPLAYPLEILLREIGGKLFFWLILIPFQLVFVFLLNRLTHISLSMPSWSEVPALLFLLAMGFAFEFLVALLIVLLGFWFEGAEGLEHFKWIAVSVFGGVIIPVPLMPYWLQAMTESLPFRYLVVVPIGILQNTVSFSYQDVLKICGYITCLTGLVLFTWQRAKYKYTSAGG
jgi:ABC-2 type transport system permease protein